MPKQEMPMGVTKPEENKSFQIYNEVKSIRELVETSGMGLKKKEKKDSVPDVVKSVTKPFEDMLTTIASEKNKPKKINKDDEDIKKTIKEDNDTEREFFKGLTEKFKETVNTLKDSLGNLGKGMAEASFNMLMGPLQLITKPLEEMMGGKIFDKLLGVLKPKKFKGKPTRQKILPDDPGSVHIADTIKGEGEEKKKSLKGKWLAIAAIAGGILMGVVDAIIGWIKSGEWGVSKLTGAIGAFLGGTGEGPFNAIKNAFKLGALGAGIGFFVGGGIPGAIIGGILGFVIGGILGWIGGEKISNFIQTATDWASKYISGTVMIGAVVGGIAGLALGGPIGMLAGVLVGAILGLVTDLLTGWIKERTKARFLEKHSKEVEEGIKDFTAWKTLELESKLVKGGYSPKDALALAEKTIQDKLLNDKAFQAEMDDFITESIKAKKSEKRYEKRQDEEGFLGTLDKVDRVVGTTVKNILGGEMNRTIDENNTIQTAIQEDAKETKGFLKKIAERIQEGNNDRKKQDKDSPTVIQTNNYGMSTGNDTDNSRIQGGK